MHLPGRMPLFAAGEAAAQDCFNWIVMYSKKIEFTINP
jgi:hypothetical protein